MAALNYSIRLTDGGDNGAGPYSWTVQKNPTTDFSGGTALTLDGLANNTLGTLNPQEIMYLAARCIGDNIASANESDDLN